MSKEIRVSLSMKLDNDDVFVIPVVFQSQEEMNQAFRHPFLWLTPETYAGRHSPKIVFRNQIRRVNIEPPRATTLNDKRDFYRLGLSSYEENNQTFLLTLKYASADIYSATIRIPSLQHLHQALLQPFFVLSSVNPEKQGHGEVIFTEPIIRIEVEPQYSHDLYGNLDVYTLHI